MLVGCKETLSASSTETFFLYLIHNSSSTVLGCKDPQIAFVYNEWYKLTQKGSHHN